ncbi:3-deoxy-D-manno-octulosonic acid transferase [Candidatus Rhabdochlamydia oedothoracis]|uniref:3-deoxy-D-manno-octulosonic acid transferase n=1 Tax=Candidatus Rhabdochlamydia oedothoracis TaxID=2720720 RepID=A0ABX8V221_9BACT|nr:glycosyltransferase N-terminal domain-containing protein [Candidatus Rhabdochlamydia sp. W815]QYF48901.1 3-deoxy-D-manno-octulosonic acid transferase [Candidatus Rhabdochlamydia oedothoracis]
MLLGLFALPKFLLSWSKYKGTILYRLGLKFPNLQLSSAPVIWIHAVSAGETKAAIPLVAQLQQTFPSAQIVISNTTRTGHMEAKKSLPQAKAHFFLPLDFSLIMCRLVKQISPSALFLVESDFWFHLVYYVKKIGGKVVLVNGKISERSYKRFQFSPYFTQKLFSLFDLFLVQNNTYFERFSHLISSHKIHITGNLKWDVKPDLLSSSQKQNLKERFKLANNTIMIASTHDPEEKWLLEKLDLLWQLFPNLKVLIAPRHPERFQNVSSLLQKKNYSYALSSNSSQITGEEQVILIDQMGQLTKLYQIVDLAIVGGSFVSHVGGHNIFEPVSVGTPVLFGPHMHTQKDLQQQILAAHIGLEITLDSLVETISKLLSFPLSISQSSPSMQGATKKTIDLLQNVIELKAQAR